MFEKFGKGQGADLARLAFPEDSSLVAKAGEYVAVDAVVAHIDAAADEPFGDGGLPVEDGVPGVKPVELAGDAGPEVFGVLDRVLVHGFVLFEGANVGAGAEGGGWGEEAVFALGGV